MTALFDLYAPLKNGFTEWDEMKVKRSLPIPNDGILDYELTNWHWMIWDFCIENNVFENPKSMASTIRNWGTYPPETDHNTRMMDFLATLLETTLLDRVKEWGDKEYIKNMLPENLRYF